VAADAGSAHEESSATAALVVAHNQPLQTDRRILALDGSPNADTRYSQIVDAEINASGEIGSEDQTASRSLGIEGGNLATGAR